MPDAKYDKIKHLVDVDDDILAVFTVTLGSQHHMEDLSIAAHYLCHVLTDDLLISESECCNLC